jgi:hypothetical protein
VWSINGHRQRISNKYGSLTRNKFLMNRSLLWNNMTYFKIRIVSEVSNYVRWLVKIQFARRIDVWNCMSDLKKNFWPMMRWTWFEAPPSRTYIFGWVIVSRQLHFHIYYLFVVQYEVSLKRTHELVDCENLYRFSQEAWVLQKGRKKVFIGLSRCVLRLWCVTLMDICEY